jgi:hypothetical protein
MTATEAKTAALQELAVNSRYSDGLATEPAPIRSPWPPPASMPSPLPARANTPSWAS